MAPKKTDSPLNNTRGFLKYSSLALQMILGILVFVFAGVYLDKKLALSFPWFTLVFTITGLFGTLYTAIRKL